jgi:hypothetical protein
MQALIRALYTSLIGFFAVRERSPLCHASELILVAAHMPCAGWGRMLHVAS